MKIPRHVRLVFRLALALLVVGLVLPVSTAWAQHQLRFETTVEGAITFTGNTLGLSHALDENGQGTQDSIGTFIALDAAAIDNSPAPTTAVPFPAGTTSDWTANGSSAVLDLPTNKDVEVLYAELLWGGSWSYLGENVSSSLGTPVTLAFDDGTSISVTPDGDTAITINQCGGNDTCTPPGCTCSSFAVHYYIRSAAVTEFVAEHGPGAYTVSGVPATQDHMVDSLNAAGWTLAVVYQASATPARNMAFWVGAQWVDENDDVDFEVSGFCSPPAGPVTGQALFSAIEGDAALGGDSAFIAGEDGVFAELSAPNNPTDNFFGSQINDSFGVLDTLGTFGDRNHSAIDETMVDGGRQGWDITGVELSDADLDNDQTAATLRTTSTSDSFVVTLVAMTIDVNAPSFDLSGAITVEPTTTHLGGTLTYTVTLVNDGTAVAEDVRLVLPLPDGLSLTSFEIDDVSGDANGDLVETGDLSTGVAVGDIGLGETVVVEIGVEVVSVPEPPAEAVFSTRGSINFEYLSCADDPKIVASVGADADVSVTVPRVGLTLSSSPEILTRGGQATWTFVVESSGTADASGVTLALDLPEAVDYVADSTTLNGDAVPDVGGDTPFASARVVEGPGAAPGTIEAGESATVLVSIAVPDSAPQSVEVWATVDPDGAGPLPELSRRMTLDIVGEDEPVCGNGRIEGSEGCDDGDRDDGDGCNSFCLVEPGWSCAGEPSVCERQQVDPDPDEPTPDAGGEPDVGDDGGDMGFSDADTGGGSTTGDEACGCSATSSSPSWAVLLALGLVVLRRRRAGHHPQTGS